MELVVRTFNQYEGDHPVEVANHTERGDVIDVGPDGTDWGRMIHRNPTYIVLRVDIHPTVARSMTSREPGEKMFNPALRKRLDHMDLDKLAALGYSIPDPQVCQERRFPNGLDGVHDFLNDPPISVIELTVAHFNQARRRKPSLLNPQTLDGEDPMVFG